MTDGPQHADRFAALSPERAERWSGFGRWESTFFPTVVGIELEEVREDYARMRLPFRPELTQPAGVVHGGAIATLIDSVVVPAIAGVHDEPMFMVTINMFVQYVGAARADMVAEGFVVKRGKSTVFCRVEVRSEGALVATGELVYTVRPQRKEA